MSATVLPVDLVALAAASENERSHVSCGQRCYCRSCRKTREDMAAAMPHMLDKVERMRLALKEAERWIDEAADAIQGSGPGADMLRARIKEALR